MVKQVAIIGIHPGVSINIVNPFGFEQQAASQIDLVTTMSMEDCMTNHFDKTKERGNIFLERSFLFFGIWLCGTFEIREPYHFRIYAVKILKFGKYKFEFLKF